MKTVKRIAFKDISEHIRSQRLLVQDHNFDIWVVTPTRMDTKEQARLNRQLGISNINYTSDKMKRNSSTKK